MQKLTNLLRNLKYKKRLVKTHRYFIKSSRTHSAIQLLARHFSPETQVLYFLLLYVKTLLNLWDIFKRETINYGGFLNEQQVLKFLSIVLNSKR